VLSPPEPKIKALQERYALGARATIDVRGGPSVTLESSDPSVVRVDRVGEGTADLSFVGSGQATLVLENETSVIEQTVEVARHHAFLVVLSEAIPIPIGPLSHQVILAGHQHFLIVYLDSEGERLYGHGLAGLRLSSGLELCDEPRGSLELHCLAIDAAGLHILEVSAGDEQLVLPFRTVLASDIVGIELLQPDEEELTPGTWVQVDVVGVTEDGMHVGSLHPRFEAGEHWYAGYFAYQFDPDVPQRTLNVHALSEQLHTKFRGVPGESSALGCASSEPGEEGPVPAMVTLFGLALCTKGGSRSAF